MSQYRFRNTRFRYNYEQTKNYELKKTWDNFYRRNIYKKYLLIKSITNLDEFVEFVKKSSFRLGMLKSQLVLMELQKRVPINFLKESKLIDLFDLEERIRLSLGEIQNSIRTIRIKRENILWDSIKAFDTMNEQFNSFNVYYINEIGYDSGGLTRDWYTNVCQAIKNSNALKPVPNGSCYELNITNMNYCNGRITNFIGKLIGLSFVNRISIPLKLTSSIWKFLLSERITLDDMNDYDSEIYESLKWISENDVEPLMITFVNSEDQPLCQNGKDINVNNENKNKYIELLLFDSLIRKPLNSLRKLKIGFNKIVNSKRMSIFLTYNDLKKVVNGSDFIDINDFLINVEYSETDKEKVSLFFDAISDWPQEKLAKLLKFITGSPIVPINGFGGYSSKGGKINIQFTERADRLPISHTCYNKIVLPNCIDKKIFEDKLSTAIECEYFDLV